MSSIGVADSGPHPSTSPAAAPPVSPVDVSVEASVVLSVVSAVDADELSVPATVDSDPVVVSVPSVVSVAAVIAVAALVVTAAVGAVVDFVSSSLPHDAAAIDSTSAAPIAAYLLGRPRVRPMCIDVPFC